MDIRDPRTGQVSIQGQRLSEEIARRDKVTGRFEGVLIAALIFVMIAAVGYVALSRQAHAIQIEGRV